MESLIDLIEEENNMEYVQSRIDNEGFSYCFRSYSRFKDVKDEEFHRRRLAYLDSHNRLQSYIDNKIEQNSIDREAAEDEEE